MAGTKAAGSSVFYRTFYRLFSARVAILWIMTVLIALALVMRGYIDQFCDHCVQQDAERGRQLVAHEGNIQRRDEERVGPSSNSCLSIEFAPKDSQELVALPSYPGSGNTWLRHLIEHSTGIYTGSVYNDKKLYSGGFHGEQEDYLKRTVLGVKMHRCSRRELQKFQASVFLVRNPYNAMIAEWHRYHTSKHVQVAGPETFQSDEWEEFVEEESSHWERMITNCIRETPRTLVIFYENLQTDLLVQLTQIHRFLKVPIDVGRLQCTQHHSEGRFHRSSHINFDPFTGAMVAKINGRIDSAAAVLRDLTGLRFPEDYKKSPAS